MKFAVGTPVEERLDRGFGFGVDGDLDPVVADDVVEFAHQDERWQEQHDDPQEFGLETPQSQSFGMRLRDALSRKNRDKPEADDLADANRTKVGSTAKHARHNARGKNGRKRNTQRRHRAWVVFELLGLPRVTGLKSVFGFAHEFTGL